jgi:hypothetical protein
MGDYRRHAHHRGVGMTTTRTVFAVFQTYRSRPDVWRMDAPLSTIIALLKLEPVAVERILSRGNRPCALTFYPEDGSPWKDIVIQPKLSLREGKIEY